jgi:hypothetical protein
LPCLYRDRPVLLGNLVPVGPLAKG